MQRRVALAAITGLVLAALAVPAFAQPVPAGYPPDYASLVEKAKKEGKVVLYSSTDAKQAQPLIEAFKAAYPGIAVDLNDLGTNGSYNRALSEAAAKQVGSDIVWTSAMDLQMQLVHKGLAEEYKSPEQNALPAWAIYKDTLYGTTVEPEAILYNKQLFNAQWVPKSRAELVKVLTEHKDALKGKVASFDPQKSGTGFLFDTHDLQHGKGFWDLANAFGAADGKVYGSSGAMREKVVSGEHVMAWNVIGSYALEWAKENPNLGVAFTSDYAAAFSRTAHISKGAPHPAAARLFLDFLLSQRGQKALAEHGVPSIRKDAGGLNLDGIEKMVGPGLTPIAVDDNLLYYMEPTRRAQFFQQWKKAMAH